MSRTSLNCAILVFGTVTAMAAADRQISFAKDIQPVFQKTCWNCHSASVQLSKLSLATRDAALKGGDHGPAIVPGSAKTAAFSASLPVWKNPPCRSAGNFRPTISSR